MYIDSSHGCVYRLAVRVKPLLSLLSCVACLLDKETVMSTFVVQLAPSVSVRPGRHQSCLRKLAKPKFGKKKKQKTN
jgi:hypothetical protein